MSVVSLFPDRSIKASPARLTIRRRLLGRSSRLRSLGVAAGLLGLGLTLGQSAQAATYTWDGTTADWFSNPSHWIQGGYPGAGDDAQNNTTAAMTLGSPTSVQSFVSDGAFGLNGGTFSGSLANATSTLQVNNVFTFNGGGINNFTLNQGTGGSVVFTTNGGNTITNSIINANLDLSTNNNAYVRLIGVDTINGNISLGAGGSNGIHLQDGNSNFINNGTLTGFGSIIQDNGGATVNNNNAINATGGTLTTGVTTFNNNAGATLEATGGGALTLANTNTNNNAGSTLAANGAGSLVTINGTFTGAGNNLITTAGGGRVVVDGATLLGAINTAASTALVFTTNGGNIFNGTTVNGNLDLSTNSNAYVRLIGVDTINGNISLGTGPASDGIHLQDGNSNFVLGTTGTLTGFGYIIQDNGGSTFTNKGTVNANGAGQTLTISTTNFNNTGTVKVQSGAFLFAGSGGENQTAGLTQVDGTYTTNAPLAINGGTLKGSGTVVGNVVNNGGTVAPGDSPGTLTVNGNYSQGSGGKLNIEFDNAANDLLSVSGLATTGGTLDVNYTGSSPFTAVGKTFDFLDYGSVASSITGSPFTQYFTNETALTNDTGLITGQNGFTYELFNDTAKSALELTVLTGGAPVPEASSATGFGLMLALGLGAFCLRGRAKKSKA